MPQSGLFNISGVPFVPSACDVIDHNWPLEISPRTLPGDVIMAHGSEVFGLECAAQILKPYFRSERKLDTQLFQTSKISTQL